tara:strand:- start:12931 stop:14790 length:1860 start_codon:yes stop_codon:yes gene_type:complete
MDLRNPLVTPLVGLALVSTAFAQGGDNCSIATPISGPGAYTYVNATATTSGFNGGNPAECDTADNQGLATPPWYDVFYVWTATSGGSHTFDTCSETNDTVLNLHLGGDCSAVCVDGEDGGDCGAGAQDLSSSVTIAGITSGDTYLIQIGTWDAAATFVTGTLNVTATGGPGGPNDTCASATAITGVGFLTYDNSAASSTGFDGGDAVTCHPSENLSAPNRDLFYAWTAPLPGSYRIDTCTSGFDTVLNVHAGGDCSATCIIGSDIGSCTANFDAEALLTGVAAADVFLIQVGSWSATAPTGPTDLNITLLPPPNDTCATPTLVSGEATIAIDTTGAFSSGFVGGDAVTCGLAEGALPPHKDLFYAWSSPCNGEYTFTTCPDLVSDTVITVYLGSDCAATCLGAADDSPCDAMTAAEVVLGPVSVGQEFLIQIGDWSSDPASTIVTTLEITRTGGACPPPFEIQCDPNNDHYLGNDAKLNTSSFAPGIGAGFHLEVTDGPANQFGFFLVSRGGTNAAQLFQGVLCIDLPFGRYDPNNAMNQGLTELDSLGAFDGAGVFSTLSGNSTVVTGFDVPVALPAGPGPGSIVPGDLLYFQLWFRDQDGGGGPSANFSNMAQVLFP